jgi:hypothetical protein
MPKNLNKAELAARIMEIEKTKKQAEKKKQTTQIAIQLFAVLLIIGMVLTSLSTLMR